MPPKELENIHRSLGNIEAKVDLLLYREDSRDQRVQSLEKWRWKINGAGGVIVGLLTVLGAAVKSLFSGGQ